MSWFRQKSLWRPSAAFYWHLVSDWGDEPPGLTRWRCSPATADTHRILLPIHQCGLIDLLNMTLNDQTSGSGTAEWKPSIPCLPSAASVMTWGKTGGEECRWDGPLKQSALQKPYAAAGLPSRHSLFSRQKKWVRLSETQEMTYELWSIMYISVWEFPAVLCKWMSKWVSLRQNKEEYSLMEFKLIWNVS